MVEIVAIDGPAGSGKSTCARMLAQRLGWDYIDTGAMYRAVTLAALERNVDLADGGALGEVARGCRFSFARRRSGLRTFLDGRDVSAAIRRPEVTRLVRHAASSPSVREAMRSVQRELGERRQAVLEGRDIGTVVFPDARFKFYLDADFRERARRRHVELRQRGIEVAPEETARDLRSRDESDLNRPVAPLRKAEDARLIETTSLSPSEVVDAMLEAMGKGLVPGQFAPIYYAREEERLWRNLFWELAWVVCNVVLRIFFEFRSYGAWNAPLSGGLVIAVNHQSFFDPVLVGIGVRRPLHYMARKTLFKGFLFGRLITALNAFPVERGRTGRAALRAAEDLVAEGRAVMLFPEGTRTRDGWMGETKRGIGALVARTGAPVVPVLVKGTFRAWPRARALPTPFRPVSAFVGRPVRFDRRPGESRSAFAGRITRYVDMSLRYMEAVVRLRIPACAAERARAKRKLEELEWSQVKNRS